VVVPDWLAEVVRPKPAPVPWPQMIRAALAIYVPLSVALAFGRVAFGVLTATGVCSASWPTPAGRTCPG
jgi:hypothetical protein